MYNSFDFNNNTIFFSILFCSTIFFIIFAESNKNSHARNSRNHQDRARKKRTNQVQISYDVWRYSIAYPANRKRIGLQSEHSKKGLRRLKFNA